MSLRACFSITFALAILTIDYQSMRRAYARSFERSKERKNQYKVTEGRCARGVSFPTNPGERSSEITGDYRSSNLLNDTGLRDSEKYLDAFCLNSTWPCRPRVSRQAHLYIPRYCIFRSFLGVRTLDTASVQRAARFDYLLAPPPHPRFNRIKTN